ncbi:hypothetical protein SDC9_118819 [bioreactor metagenome]|uniref:SnoaL-like domain-containing protein n=1 Tax=bioreactor metagenome TaxID=1076179 RepID=A0A645C3B2_9ZZZZ
MRSIAKLIKNKWHYRVIILLCYNLFTIFVFVSCTLFETREPEDPNADTKRLPPPTTPDILIDNFIESIKSKDIENYIACFHKTNYLFIASNDAITKFPSLFDKWQIDNERSCFLAFTTSIGKLASINLTFSNRNFETISTDSAILITNYSLNYDSQNIINQPDKYIGKLALTLLPVEGGLWTISRWQDFTVSNDTIKDTWSHLKAYFHN